MFSSPPRDVHRIAYLTRVRRRCTKITRMTTANTPATILIIIVLVSMFFPFRWWPMVYFLVFKAPPEGGVHVFRPGEPFAQILFLLPEEASFDLVPMPDDEAAEREMQSRRIYQSRATLSAETEWTSATNTVFDGTYRHIGAASEEKQRRRGGELNCSSGVGCLGELATPVPRP